MRRERKYLQSQDEIDRLRESIPQKFCANCGKKMPKLDCFPEYRRYEALGQHYASVNGVSMLVDDDDGYISHRLEGWKYVPMLHKYDPFCTLRCAESFARSAYKAGYRIEEA